MIEILETDEIHFAPLSGSIGVFRNDEFVAIPRGELALLQSEFLRLRNANELQYERTQTSGHPFFHGHRGNVDIYTVKEAATTT